MLEAATAKIIELWNKNHMADFSDFVQSPNIEDRRRTPFAPTPGVFGDGISTGNVFDGGTLAGLNANTDFATNGAATPLGVQLGINNLAPVTGPIFPSQPLRMTSGVGDSIRTAESGGDPNAKNPNSSASGPDQFLDSTWLSTVKQARPDLAQGKSDADLLALKTNPQLSGEMRDYYANQNQAILSKAGVPVTPGTTYLAHFAGPQGAVKVLQADPSAMAGDILGPAVLKANPFLQGMTAQGLQAWAAKKMGAAVPQAGAQTAQATPASPPSAPLSLQPPIPQQAPPIFAGQPQSAPQAPFQAPAPMQAPPIFASPRKQIDLSGLRAALAARAPIFPQG